MYTIPELLMTCLNRIEKFLNKNIKRVGKAAGE
jgi:hypothetical protein